MQPEAEYKGPRLSQGSSSERVLIGAAFAGATAVAAFNEVDKVVEAFKQDKRLDLGERAVARRIRASRSTIMLLGSDIRSKQRARRQGRARTRSCSSASTRRRRRPR